MTYYIATFIKLFAVITAAVSAPVLGLAAASAVIDSALPIWAKIALAVALFSAGVAGFMTVIMKRMDADLDIY